jgi:hypothetical protein
MSKRLRLIYTVMPNYHTDSLAGRALCTERVSLAHGPSERPRKARFAFWAAVGDELNIEISGGTAHVLELDTRLYCHGKLSYR